MQNRVRLTQFFWLLIGCSLMGFTISVDAQQATSQTTTADNGTSVQSNALLESTRVQDINQLDYYQLVDLIESLSHQDGTPLSTQGGVDELRNRLFDYYEVPSEQRTVPEEEPADTEVTIESALTGRYFTIDEIDEQNLRLGGDVELILIDNVEEVTHTIQADSITYNQQQELVSAQGNVFYTLTRTDSTEEFSGNSLLFEITDWQGVFLTGRGISDENNETNVVYRYEADLITRSADDIVIMENAIISSSDPEQLYYRVEADKIWILGGSEWALLSATLYVGAIPLFYFPYFFRPGDEVVFHPVFGSREREGIYIQTTTYLLGEKEESPATSLSFLQLFDSDEDYRKVLDGIFLRRSSIEPEETDPLEGSVLKLLVDYYSLLGGYIGLDGQLNIAESAISNLDFEIGLGINRYIYQNGGVDGTEYTTFFNSDGIVQEHLIESYFFSDTPVPFRYFINLDLALSLGAFNSSLIFEYHSDRYIASEFDDRAEENDLLGIVLGEVDFETTATISTTSSFVWRSTSSLNISDIPISFINSIAINDLLFGVNWSSKQVVLEDFPQYKRDPTLSLAPEQYFFYPSQLFAPSFDINITGTIIDSNNTASSTTEQQQQEVGEIQFDLQPPWIDQGQPITATEQEDEQPDTDATDPSTTDSSFAFEIAQDLTAPTAQSNLTGYTVSQPAHFTLGYSLMPSFDLQHITDNTEWLAPQDIDFALRYSTLSLDGAFDLNLSLNLYENYLLYTNQIQLRGRYRSVIEGVGLEDEDESVTINLQNNASQNNYFGIISNNNLSSNFLQNLEQLAKSQLQYNIAGNVYEYKFSTITDDRPVYEEVWLEWDNDTITAHSASLAFTYDTTLGTQQFTTTYTLPPLLQNIQWLLGLQFGPFSITNRISVTEKEKGADAFNVGDLSTTAALNIVEEVTLSGTMQTDLAEAIEEGGDPFVKTLSTSLKAWFVNATLNFERTQAVEFNGNFVNEGRSSPWNQFDAEALRLQTLVVTANESIESEYFWRNRVRVTANIGSTLNVNFLRYTQSSLRLNYGITLFIHQFLQLRINSSLTNSAIYLYNADLARTAGRTPRNLLTDFLQSINIFNEEDLEEGLFKLDSLSIEAVHDLIDWELIFGYTTQPLLITTTTPNQYVWDQRFNIAVAWKPITELRRDITITRQGDEESEITIE